MNYGLHSGDQATFDPFVEHPTAHQLETIANTLQMSSKDWTVDAVAGVTQDAASKATVV